MPLVETTSKKYVSIDTNEVAFKMKTPDGDALASSYEGYLVDVQWKEDEWQGRPANKYHFIFKDSLNEDANTEIVQSGDNSVFSGSLINYLLGIEGKYGKISIGVYRPDGKEFIANWVYHNNEKAEWAHGIDQINKWADSKYGGDKTALFKDLFEKNLKPKLEKQGTLAGDSKGEDINEAVDSSVDLSDLYDVDSELPF